ncbi:hypothetical protein NDU88_011197 [Pleurodeles waltl]|uniref:Uncharacterized protein n=1 Tax=Pleurodeles waltl TaxID=8319 RepID=A0AAV7R2C6_PLEWA|nr:hypothetical protein NDU88_011197 [Pleurodeles waltl]
MQISVYLRSGTDIPKTALGSVREILSPDTCRAVLQDLSVREKRHHQDSRRCRRSGALPTAVPVGLSGAKFRYLKKDLKKPFVDPKVPEFRLSTDGAVICGQP